MFLSNNHLQSNNPTIFFVLFAYKMKKGNFCCGTSRKQQIGYNTPPTLAFAEYHYEIANVCQWTPPPLK